MRIDLFLLPLGADEKLRINAKWTGLLLSKVLPDGGELNTVSVKLW